MELPKLLTFKRNTDTVHGSPACSEEDVKKLGYIEELTSLLEQQVASFEEGLDRDIAQLQSVHEYSHAILQQTALLHEYKNECGEDLTSSMSRKENLVNAVDTTRDEKGKPQQQVAGDKVSADELEQLSKSIRGRLTVSAVNDYLDMLRRMVQTKTVTVKKDRRKMSSAEMKVLEVLYVYYSVVAHITYSLFSRI